MNTEHGLMMAPAVNRAVMLTRGQLASHFTRAEQLQIVNPEGTVLATLPNPAAGEGCGGKQALLVTLKAHQGRCCSNQGTIPQFGDLIS